MLQYRWNQLHVMSFIDWKHFHQSPRILNVHFFFNAFTLLYFLTLGICSMTATAGLSAPRTRKMSRIFCSISSYNERLYVLYYFCPPPPPVYLTSSSCTAPSFCPSFRKLAQQHNLLLGGTRLWGAGPAASSTRINGSHISNRHYPNRQIILLH